LVRSSSVHSRSKKNKAGEYVKKKRRGLISKILSLFYSSKIDWRQFIVAETENGEIIGCVRLKKHSDFYELATASIDRTWRGKGVDQAIGKYVLAYFPRPLWGTCLNRLTLYYKKFGGTEITDPAQIPAYFRRRQRIFNLLLRLWRRKKRLTVMVLR
jgi:hypothetical protein